jgi:hypothetical protein
MTDTQGERARSRWTVRALAEVVLIAAGVFLGLAGEQWRDTRQREARAVDALQRIRAEVAANREEVRRVSDYHVKTHDRLKIFLEQSADKREAFHLDGILPAQFEQTAWHLAQSTQALVDLDAELTFDLARIYGVQARYVNMSAGITNAMYLRPPSENLMAFLHSLALYYADVVLLEPQLEKLYGDVLPRIDRELER